MRLLKFNFNLILALACSAAYASPTPVTRARYLMGTICEIQAYGPASALDKAFEEIARLENILSTWKPDSEVSRLNALQPPKPRKCSPELAQILKLSQQISQLSAGAFDVTIKPILEAWGQQGKARHPDRREIQQALSRTGWRYLKTEANSVTFAKAGMALDFGAIGKGYALDRAAEILKTPGVTAALLNFGGQLLAMGAPPGESGWKAMVENREIILKNQSASTSSQLEAKSAGKTKGHIFNPLTGLPAAYAGSVTVIAPSAAEADALSTAFFVMGEEKTKKILESPRLQNRFVIWFKSKNRRS